MMIDALVFGEILFDRFEDRICLGGAPLNFAWYLRQFGLSVAMISAVGRDELGEQALRALKKAGIEDRWVERADAPTGTVEVLLDRGQPNFVIHDNVAWDYIKGQEADWPSSRLVYFGTLGQRHPVSRQAAQRLLSKEVPHRFFDVNLRQDHQSREVILDGLQNATIVKLNHEEWALVAGICGLDSPNELIGAFDLKMVAVTQGDRGASLYTRDEKFHSAGVPAEVKDAVGAGDAFSAALAAGVLRGKDPVVALDAACRIGAFVVTRPGAQANLSPELTASLRATD